MMKRTLIMFLVLIASCTFQRMPLMTIESYTEVDIGMTVNALVEKFGQPINKFSRDHQVIYEYVERFQLGNTPQSVVESRRYFFVIESGSVVSKYMQIKNQPPYRGEDLVNPTDIP